LGSYDRTIRKISKIESKIKKLKEKNKSKDVKSQRLNMTAKEMFEELGFQYTVLSKRADKGFATAKKKVVTLRITKESFGHTMHVDNPLRVSKDLMHAILKSMEELGE
jgi:guanylate kinase